MDIWKLSFKGMLPIRVDCRMYHSIALSTRFCVTFSLMLEVRISAKVSRKFQKLLPTTVVFFNFEVQFKLLERSFSSFWKQVLQASEETLSKLLEGRSTSFCGEALQASGATLSKLLERHSSSFWRDALQVSGKTLSKLLERRSPSFWRDAFQAS